MCNSRNNSMFRLYDLESNFYYERLAKPLGNYIIDSKYLLKYEFKYVLEYINHHMLRLVNEIINPFRKIRIF